MAFSVAFPTLVRCSRGRWSGPSGARPRSASPGWRGICRGFARRLPGSRRRAARGRRRCASLGRASGDGGRGPSVVPSTHQSGDHNAHGRITKKGSAELRAICVKQRSSSARQSSAQSLLPKGVCEARLQNGRGSGGASAVSDPLLDAEESDQLRCRKLGVEKGPFRRTAQHLYRLKVAPIATTNA